MSPRTPKSGTGARNGSQSSDVDVDGVKEFEAFDHPDSWAAVSKSVARKYAPELDRAGRLVFDLKKEAVEETATEFLRSLARVKPSPKPERFAVQDLSSDSAVAEYVELAGDGIHLIAARREKDPVAPTYQPVASWPGGLYPATSGRSFYMTTVESSAAAPQSRWSENRFESLKAARCVSRSLMDNEPAAWSVIERRIREQGEKPSPRTLSSTLKAGVREGYIRRRGNGRRTYQLTAKGREVAEKKEEITA